MNGFVSYLGQTYNGLRIRSIVGRQNQRGYPIYEAICQRCQSVSHVKHQRIGVDSCSQCALQAMRETLAQSPSGVAKVAAIKAYDERVDQDYKNPSAPVSVEPVASEPPKPPEKPLDYTGSGAEIVPVYMKVHGLDEATATKVVGHLVRMDDVRHPSVDTVQQLIAQYQQEEIA